MDKSYMDDSLNVNRKIEKLNDISWLARLIDRNGEFLCEETSGERIKFQLILTLEEKKFLKFFQIGGFIRTSSNAEQWILELNKERKDLLLSLIDKLIDKKYQAMLIYNYLNSSQDFLSKIFDEPNKKIKELLHLEEISNFNFETYQALCSFTAIYPDLGNNPFYPTLGLAGEVGEIANDVKTIMRDNNGIITDEKKEELKGEISDVMWYISTLATELGLDIKMIAQYNIEKLFSRKERGVLTGSGDNR